MDTNQVDTTEQVQGVQLPLTERESQRALAIALADPNVRPMLDAEYRSITQQELVAAEQLIVKAMTFHASSIPAEDVGSAAACGIKRCAQLLLAAGENVALQVIPVVDLSSGIVVNALPFNRAPR
jgi:RNA 3'-terminal phosphate cyclase